jgi:hypothetical protein
MFFSKNAGVLGWFPPKIHQNHQSSASAIPPVEPAARQRGAAASSNQRRGCGGAAAKERLSREALADDDFPMFFPNLMVILDGGLDGDLDGDFCRVLGTIHDIHDGEEQQMVISHYRIVVCIVYEWLYFDVIRSG